MVKKILLILLLGTNSFILRADCTCNSQRNELSTTQIIIGVGTWTVVGAIAAPFVLPASALAAITAAAAATKAAVIAGATYAAPYVIPTTTVAKVGAGITVAQKIRPYILETTKEKLKYLQKEKEQKQRWAAREEFITCLKQNKFGSARNSAGRPSACEDLALAYALATNFHNLDRRTQAFKDGKCFCDWHWDA